MVRNNICLNSHPAGCAASVRAQIGYVKKTLGAEPRFSVSPHLVLVIGCSTGYGLASRIAAAFGYDAATVGVSLEKSPTAAKPGTPGWYNNRAFDREAAAAGLASATLNGDAFSAELKAQTVAAIRETAAKAGIPPRVDLVIYSLASPVRTDPKDGVLYRSVIKPIGAAYSGRTLDPFTGKISMASAEPATEDEIAATIKVMGGEDWELWMDALKDVLSVNVRTVAYTYIGPELSWAIYKNGTIGRAKEDLRRAARAINKKGTATAWVSVNKALVTRSSAVIPIIPLYVSCLFKVMKDKGLHEGCIEQMTRLLSDRLYNPSSASDSANVPVDDEGRIRMDDREMRPDVQKAVAEQMDSVNEDNVFETTDAAGFKHDFLEANGFDVAGVDYDADVETL
jgi:enoyl-[acyl-carrier protein] reductase/trans-2-enoyl-CoA reductase (NAD+)